MEIFFLTTTIDGNANGRIFDVTAGTFTLANLSLMNGIADNGGAIQVTGANLILNNVTLTSNTATKTVVVNDTTNSFTGSGGAIYVGTGATLMATGCTMSKNMANRAGGAIEAVAGTEITLTNVDLMENNAGVSPAIAAPGNGGALHITGAGTAFITGGTVSKNVAAAEGGGLWNGSGTMTIKGTTISENIASGAGADNGGGGIYNLNNGTLNISKAMITNNIANGAAGSGGGILNDVGSKLNIDSTVISGNIANRAGGGIEDNSGTSTILLTEVNLDENIVVGPPGNGGGLHITGGGSIIIMGGTVNGNSAAREGGGLWNGSGTMTITNTQIDGNIALGNAADDGGAGIFNNGGPMNLTDVEITNNMSTGTSASGGGILSLSDTVVIMSSLFENNSANRAGGAIEVVIGGLMITNTDFMSNDVNGTAGTANPGNGGAIHISGAAITTIEESMFSENAAGREGGALWAQTGGSMSINNVSIDNNMASGNGVAFGGGGVFVNGGMFTAMNSTISNNTSSGAAGNGGGVHVKAGSSAMLKTTTISGNTSAALGGGVYNNGYLTINASTIANNTAVDGGGIANVSDTTATIKNSIVATNMGSSPDVYSSPKVIMSNGYNLIGVGSATAFTSLSTDLMGTTTLALDPKISSLADNGGMIWKHSLLAESPAYNAGDPADLFADQLGNEVFDGIRDIGAVEAQSILLSVEDFALSGLSIYPNPVSAGKVSIELNAFAGLNGIGKIIEIGSGAIVQQFKVNNGNNELAIDNLTSGIYLDSIIFHRCGCKL